MNTLPTETRFRHAIRAENFTMFEMCGFRDNPTAALIAGAAIGYKMACQDMQNAGSHRQTARQMKEYAERAIREANT